MMSFFFNAFLIQSGENCKRSSSNLNKVDVSQIKKIEYDDSDPLRKEKYLAYLGKDKAEDYLLVFKNDDKICCFRKCNEPECWIVIDKYHFYMIQNTYEQDQNILRMKIIKNMKEE
jgi:hypothetical protein